MSDNIDGAISRIELKIHKGKLKPHRVKAKTDVSKKVDKEVARVMNDNIASQERKAIVNKASKKAENPVAKAKRELSKEIGKDLGLEMS